MQGRRLVLKPALKPQEAGSVVWQPCRVPLGTGHARHPSSLTSRKQRDRHPRRGMLQGWLAEFEDDKSEKSFSHPQLAVMLPGSSHLDAFAECGLADTHRSC